MAGLPPLLAVLAGAINAVVRATIKTLARLAEARFFTIVIVALFLGACGLDPATIKRIPRQPASEESQQADGAAETERDGDTGEEKEIPNLDFDGKGKTVPNLDFIDDFEYEFDEEINPIEPKIESTTFITEEEDLPPIVSEDVELLAPPKDIKLFGTPLQKAILFKEILDKPRSLRPHQF